MEDAMKLRAIAPAAALAALVAPAAAQGIDWNYPAVQNYGPVVPVPGATAEPQQGLRYKVVFNVTAGAPGDGRVSPDLAAVARFVNLLALSGMEPQDADIVAVVHAAATPAVISDPHFRARFGASNPDAELIRQLEANGVEVVVCGQAVAGAGFPLEAVLEPVEVSISAMTELAQRQLQGYALMPCGGGRSAPSRRLQPADIAPGRPLPHSGVLARPDASNRQGLAGLPQPQT
jgi:intracellular sulfur oxidation DsrE/DsrF family protein